MYISISSLCDDEPIYYYILNCLSIASKLFNRSMTNSKNTLLLDETNNNNSFILAVLYVCSCLFKLAVTLNVGEE